MATLTSNGQRPCRAGNYHGLRGASVYDPYYRDYHVWDRDEILYYQRWEHDTHRDHRDFNRRSADEQKDYWSWRHSQH